MILQNDLLIIARALRALTPTDRADELDIARILDCVEPKHSEWRHRSDWAMRTIRVMQEGPSRRLEWRARYLKESSESEHRMLGYKISLAKKKEAEA